MPTVKNIVLALIGPFKAGKTVFCAQSGKLAVAPGQQLMGIGLVAHIEYDLIPWRIKHAVQRNRQLHHPQVRGQMAARLGNGFHQHLANFSGQLTQAIFLQLLYIVWRMYL